MATTVSCDKIMKDLNTFCDNYSTFKKAALALKVSPAQLSITVNGKSAVIPERILKKLGYRSELAYFAMDKRQSDVTKQVKKSLQIDKTKPATRIRKPGPVDARAKKPTLAKTLNRDAGTGRAVTKAYAAANPKTTVEDVIDVTARG